MIKLVEFETCFRFKKYFRTGPSLFPYRTNTMPDLKYTPDRGNPRFFVKLIRDICVPQRKAIPPYGISAPFLSCIKKKNQQQQNNPKFKSPQRASRSFCLMQAVSPVQCTVGFVFKTSCRLLLVYSLAHMSVKVSVKQLCTCLIQFVGAFLS